jgi:hypothetical protein
MIEPETQIETLSIRKNSFGCVFNDIIYNIENELCTLGFYAKDVSEEKEREKKEATDKRLTQNNKDSSLISHP